ncbi:LysR family transcriptional regulator [Luxibacter massiliensis]|uniref:LysR family transcriptional regulator n=1 Tax=Luxibacter massiliensis TaxID=2219695 RepID=UPI000F051D0B|nr:LysR family transcriptional regulator [Luxibacter massiliensis]
MNLYQLRYFALLARIGHFRKTAEQLCIAQPSLSHSIALLEQELGVSLFEKQGRRSVLTSEGLQFLTYVEKSLEILDEGILDMQHIAMGEGIIELGFLRTLGVEFIPEMARRFLESQKDKNIYFKFHTGITASLIDGLKDEKYDLVFCTKRESEPNIEFFPVSRQDLVVIVPRNHPLSKRYTISLEELGPYPQVCFSHSSGLRSIIDNLFKKIHVTPQVAYEIEEDIVIAGLVSKGFGVAVVPYMADLLRMDVKIIQIASPYWERNFYMATLKTHHLTPVVQNFHNYVIHQYSDNL